MFDSVKKYFGDSPWVVTQFSGQPILRFVHDGENGRYMCFAHCREAEDRFVVYTIGIAATPDERRLPVAEFLTRANYGLIIGNFEMDMNDGEIRYKTSIDVQGDRLSTAMVDHLVRISVNMMDKYFPGITAVIEEGTDPATAIEAIEGPPQQQSE
jgi:hypothetical protein